MLVRSVRRPVGSLTLWRPGMCVTCEGRVRFSRLFLLVGLALPLTLPRGAYLDHLALICRGPAHHLCGRGRLRGSVLRITGAQLWHACMGRTLCVTRDRGRAGRNLLDTYAGTLTLANLALLCAGIVW